ncbi:unnamed protein product [Oikopleura dioica]|uniref:Chloride channel CLIC-like protein 1 n=1 Tax=Oikopleura dioica TaxID=34765 RepID=E4X846_OIKDI|nr:unnamed protein product [Oikopleura dioica]
MKTVILLLIGLGLAETQELDPSVSKRMPAKYKKGDGRQSLKSSADAETQTSLTKEFFKQEIKTQQKLCRGLVEIDYSKESAVKILTKMLNLIVVTGTIDEVQRKLTVMLNLERLEELKAIPHDTQLTMSELSDSLNDLLYPVPADDRNILEKTLDQLGVDQFTFYAITGSTVIFAAITFIRFHGKGLVERFGVSILFKITFAVLWLLNLPAAYEKALQKETAEWKASQFKEIPQECRGQTSITDRFISYFSFDTIDPCVKYHQQLIEPKYRVSWFAVATTSFMEIINPVFTEVARGIRSSLDTLLDGKGFYHQLIYSMITLIVFLFGFMWLTGFKFKLSSLLFGIEFGPEKEQKQGPKEDEKKKLLMIEKTLQKLEALQIELSKNIDNTKQKPVQLGLPGPGPSGDNLSAVENINSRESDSDGFDCVNDFNGAKD